MAAKALLDREALGELLGAGGPVAASAGARIRKLRSQFGWTQAVLAELTDTTVPTINRIEHGMIIPRDYLKASIAYALCAEVSELWEMPTRARLGEVAAA